MMIKLLFGGSPCQRFSIAQSKDRETTPSGIGWELFLNYVIAKEKFKPDYFLYENVKSMSNAIRDEITKQLGVEPILINSALVSAQNRNRYYWTNIPNVEQPQDRGILLKDVLGNRVAPYQTLGRKLKTMIAEPICTIGEKSRTLKAQYHKSGVANFITNREYLATGVAEPVCLRYERTEEGKRLRNQYESGELKHGYNEHRELQPRTDGKSNTLSTVQKDNLIAKPVRVGTLRQGQGYRIYSAEGESIALTSAGGGLGSQTGLYAIPIEFADNIPARAISLADGKSYPVYEVKSGKITIKGKEYDIKLSDGFYIICKLTVTECCRLQTLPDDFCKAVSPTRGYQGCGNGWTAEVIMHILNYANIPLDTHIQALSMYDGIGTARYCLDKMGYKNITYKAYEIDKYAMTVANDNYADIQQFGDAFQVRNEDWKY